VSRQRKLTVASDMRASWTSRRHAKPRQRCRSNETDFRSSESGDLTSLSATWYVGDLTCCRDAGRFLDHQSSFFSFCRSVVTLAKSSVAVVDNLPSRVFTARPERRILTNVSVFLFACLSASTSHEPQLRFSPNFSSSVARSSSGDVVIRYVFSVLWKTSCLRITARSAQT